MKIIKRSGVLFLPLIALMALILADEYSSSRADNLQLSAGTFYVQWYDVGKAALEGLKGIKRIDKGFRESREINTVTYDASIVSVEEMEDALRNAATYRGTVN